MKKLLPLLLIVVIVIFYSWKMKPSEAAAGLAAEEILAALKVEADKHIEWGIDEFPPFRAEYRRRLTINQRNANDSNKITQFVAATECAAIEKGQEGLVQDVSTFFEGACADASAASCNEGSVPVVVFRSWPDSELPGIVDIRRFPDVSKDGDHKLVSATLCLEDYDPSLSKQTEIKVEAVVAYKTAGILGFDRRSIKLPVGKTPAIEEKQN
jgi:hypothetical protein